MIPEGCAEESVKGLFENFDGYKCAPPPPSTPISSKLSCRRRKSRARARCLLLLEARRRRSGEAWTRRRAKRGRG
eukprot:6558572-Prymnesium_polylepis.1